MHAQRKSERNMMVCIATIAVLGSGAAGAAGRASKEDAAVLAKAVLTPYATAHAYKGTRTTTTIIGNDRSHLTTTTIIQSRCDSQGALARLRAQTTSWGDERGEQITGTEDRVLTYDGTTLWVYQPEMQRYHRDIHKPAGLFAVLNLPSIDAAWTFAPHTRDDEPDERGIRATINDTVWTLYIDTAGRLRRIVRVSGKGSTRVVATSTIRDLAFNAAADLPDERYAFHPPDGAQEAQTVIAQEGNPPSP